MDEVMTNYIQAASAGRIRQAQSHHLVTLSYPDETLSLDGEELSCPTILHTADRYEPLPLINDPAIIANAFRDSLEETAFYLLRNANVGRDFADFRKSCKQARGTIKNLQKDVQSCLHLSGCTSINFVTTLRGDAQREPIEHIRILRKTVLLTADGRTKQYEGLYHATIPEWDAFRPCSDVIKLMEHLLMGTSDRAILHIDATLRCQGRPLCEPSNWLEPRRPQYGAVIGAVTRGVNFLDLDAEDRSCPLCFCKYDEPDHDAISLHCNEKHMLCRKCLVQCCQAEAVKTRCPFCRSPVFTDDKTIGWLKTGSLGKTYDADPQYNAWENHERSMADLDKHHAESIRTSLEINARLLKDIWDILVKWEQDEPAQSTPIPLNPACAAGSEMVTKAFQATVDRLDSTRSPTDTIFENIIKTLRTAIVDPSAQSLSLVPGYEACLRRRVSRTLQFANVRRCKCTQRRYHDHGLRKYYNDEFFGLSLRPSQRGELCHRG